MNVNKLKAKCIERGMNIDSLSKAVGIGRSAFYRRLNKDAFSVEEAGRIAENLNLSQQELIDIFFESLVA